VLSVQLLRGEDWGIATKPFLLFLVQRILPREKNKQTNWMVNFMLAAFRTTETSPH